MSEKNKTVQEFDDSRFESAWAEGLKSGDDTLELEIPGEEMGPNGFPTRVRGRFEKSDWEKIRQTPSGKRKELFDKMGELLRNGSFSEATGETFHDSGNEIAYWLEMRRWMLVGQMEEFVKTITTFQEKSGKLEADFQMKIKALNEKHMRDWVKAHPENFRK